MRYCEDLLLKWDKRIQFEATLLFFFSVVSGSSFVSLYMFTQLNAVLNFIPLLYVVAMFCWWYLCKRLVFNTEEKTRAVLVTNVVAMVLWLIISAAVSLGGWDEWGWGSQDVDVPASDNVFRFMNCMLLTLFVGTLTYDYYNDLSDRTTRIRIWTLCIWLHALVSLSYFVEWVVDAHLSGDHESIIPRWMATLGCAFLILSGVPVFWGYGGSIALSVMFSALALYWWGSASLDCDFYADTADMTVMPGYHMLGTMALLILLESLPTMSTEIYVLGSEPLMDLQGSDEPKVKVVLPEMINLEENENEQQEPERVQPPQQAM